tara:strand:- start:2994 stop:3260 length:267 start_codon:yes stop_codon:yes gene_type:complete
MKTKWILLVIFHMFIIIGNAVSFFIAPFLAPWYISLPICSFIFLITFSKEIKCPLTNWENNMRASMGKKQIGGFIGHYVIKPLSKLLP